MPSHRHPAQRQRGVATVFIAMVLLLAMGLIALYTSRSAIVEQRISANEVRAKQALAAATAGLDRMLAHLRFGGIDQNDDDVPDRFDVIDVPLESGTPTPPTFSVRLVAANPASLPRCPDAPGPVDLNGAAEAAATDTVFLAVSCGWNDDNSAVQRVMELFERRPPFSGPPSAPLVTKSGIGLGGNPAVFNYFNDLTVWSGETLDKTGSPSSTFIRDIADPAHAAVDSDFDFRDIGGGAGAPPGYVESTTNHANNLKLGHDVVGGDSSLRDMNDAEFFEHFMNTSPTDYKAAANEVVSADDFGAIAEKNGKVIWVDGDLTLDVNLGTPTDPVVLIVNGKLEIKGNEIVHGFVFVLGKNVGGVVEGVQTNGKPIVYGSLITLGTFKGAGTPSIVYDPATLGTAYGTLGSANRVAGTWRDW